MDEPFIPFRRSWSQKFGGAFRGWWIGSRGHSSFIVHLPAALVALGAGSYFRIQSNEWCLLIVCIASVIAAEFFNSALESLAKAITPSRNEHIGQALDIASGAVLAASVGAVVVGLIIFLPRCAALFSK